VLLRYSAFHRPVTRIAASNPLLGFKSTFAYNNVHYTSKQFFGQKVQKPKETKAPKEETKSKVEEEEQQEFHHDETLDEDNAANFSPFRRALFVLGKALKYAFWSYCVLFAYHFYLVINKDKPEEAVG
jgi:hypothetical protein